MPNNPQQNYMLCQIRYLGVFETIQIRKKTFPSRRTFNEFVKIYKPLYPKINESNDKKITLKILEQVTKNNKNYMLG